MDPVQEEMPKAIDWTRVPEKVSTVFSERLFVISELATHLYARTSIHRTMFSYAIGGSLAMLIGIMCKFPPLSIAFGNLIFAALIAGYNQLTMKGLQHVINERVVEHNAAVKTMVSLYGTEENK